MRRLAIVLSLVLSGLARSVAGEPAFEERLRSSARRALPLLERAARSYPEHRRCFSCHHQTLPMLALTTARDAGFEVDEELVDDQLAFSRKTFEKRREGLAKGERIGGRAMTVTYGLWTFDVAAAEPDELSTAMVEYLLLNQEEDGSWRPPSFRPPMADEPVTPTVLGLDGLRGYGSDAQRERVEQAAGRALAYLRTVKPRTTEGRVMRLWGLDRADADEALIAAARKAVLDGQREDGGWAQTDESESDAYATGQATYVLRVTGTPADAEPVRRAAEFLLSTQEADGSWHVETRAEPVQQFFDNGDPHGRDQFVSTPATAWAATALIHALP